jgi:hypothetical protein
LTRVARTIEFVDGDDIEEDAEDKFEKVDHRYATVGDLVADSNIKLRKGSAIVRACKRLRIAADVALKRAKGKVDIHLCDIADKD